MTKGEAIQKLIDVFDEYREVADAVDVLAGDPGFDPPGGCKHDDPESLIVLKMDYTGTARAFCATCLRWAGAATHQPLSERPQTAGRRFLAGDLVTREALRVLGDSLKVTNELNRAYKP